MKIPNIVNYSEKIKKKKDIAAYKMLASCCADVKGA